jgi:hypothetical protein
VFEMTVEFNANTAIARIEKVLSIRQFALDNQVLKDSNEYCPVAEGDLRTSGVTYSRVGDGFLGWNKPYAHNMYYGTKFNFSKDKNLNARAKWFEEAKTRNLSKWLEIAGDV